jgi:hypothetical protein
LQNGRFHASRIQTWRTLKRQLRRSTLFVTSGYD